MSLRKLRRKSERRKKNIIAIGLIVAIALSVVIIEVIIWSNRSYSGQVWDINSSANTSLNTTPQNTTENGSTENQNLTEEKKPDLRVVGISVNTSDVIVGENISVSVDVKNAGEVNVSEVEVVVSAGSIVLYNDTINLSAGEEKEISCQWETSEVGDYEIEARVDAGDVVDEKNEDNNRDSVGVVVKKQIVEDVSDEFERKSFDILSGEAWYSDRFSIAPEGGPGYTYFEITRDSTHVYYLDVAIAGFRTKKVGNVASVEIPDGSIGGWNGRQCLKKKQSADTCIWNGPLIILNLEFSGHYLKVRDVNGNEDKASASDSRIKEVELDGIRVAEWPEELITFRSANGPKPDYLVPVDFEEVVGNQIYIYPMRWNPTTHKARVTTWIRFKITTD